jgi:hypothetical protein
VITVTLHNSDNGLTSTTLIPSEHGPALRSAINEIRNELGERASGAHKYPKEEALTQAIAAVGQLAACVNTVVPIDHPKYL